MSERTGTTLPVLLYAAIVAACLFSFLIGFGAGLLVAL